MIAKRKYIMEETKLSQYTKEQKRSFVKNAIILFGLGSGLSFALTFLLIFIGMFFNNDYVVILNANKFHEARVELIAIILSVVVIIVSGVLVCKNIRKES